jgi:hypothetical protein
MTDIGSARYDAIKLGDLLKLYVEYDDGSAKSELSNMLIEGVDLVDALDYALLDLEHDSKGYKKLERIFKTQRKSFLEERENYHNLIENIKELVKGKEGSFVEKIKNILKVAKQR